MAAESEFDVFLSYATGDERWAARLNDELSDRGLRVFFDRSRLAPGEPWPTAFAEALSTSRVLGVLWSRAARDSEWVMRVLDRFEGATVCVGLERLKELPRDDVELVRLGDDTAYDSGPEGVTPDQWRAAGSAIARFVRQVSGQAAQLELSPSVRGLAGRLPGDVSGTEIVTDLLSTHTMYARGQGRSYTLGEDPENVLRQPVSAWIDEASGMFEATKQPELHGRQLIIGLAFAYPPLGRRLLESGLFHAIEGELRESLDLILTEAGKRAREALEPVPLAGYVADSLRGDDMFDLRAEVAGLCAVIAAESVHPPLSIGLFGPWGSGKSFYMRLMQQEIRRIAIRSMQARGQARDNPFCSEIVQIEFNAWHYLDANLWASLMARVWEGLAAHGGETPDPRLTELFKRLETSSTLLADAGRDAEQAEKRVNDARSRLDDLARERAKVHDKLGELSARDVASEVADDENVRAAIAAVEREAGLPSNSLDLTAVRDLGNDLRGLGKVRAVWRILAVRPLWRRSIVALGVLLLALAVGFVFAQDWVASIGAAVVAAIGIVVPAARDISTVIRPTGSFMNAAHNALEQARKAEAMRQAQIAQAEREQRATLLQLEEESAARRNKLVEAEAQQDDAERAIEEISEGRAAMRFIRERAESGDYERHLGLISMIQRDLAKLSNLMTPPSTNGTPRKRDEKLPQIDRIVLYIDDLDRCPSHLVIEVLQAVHLLLAYPLFVVVVGVDPRWLVSSLTRHHSALLGSEGAMTTAVDEDKTAHYTAKPQEYLEKIFQLPLILKPMEEHGYGRLVTELLPIRAAEAKGDADTGREQSDDTAPGELRTTQATASTGDDEFDPGHRNLEIEPAELELVKQLWPTMPSPRAVKRLSNVYRFVRAQIPPHDLPAFTGKPGQQGDYPAVLFLLAVLIGLPEDAPAVLSVICDDKHETWQDVVADGSDIPEPALDKLRRATEGFDAYPLEKVRAQVPRVVRFSFSFWDVTSTESELSVHAS